MRERSPITGRSRLAARRIVAIASVVAVLAGGGAYVAVARPFASGDGAGDGTADNSAPVATATIVQRSLSAQTQVSATLGYGGSYSVVNQARGTLTSLPSVGQVVANGQTLYKVDGSPVILLYGSTPAYRDLAEGASASDVTGSDVAELNADLVALGYVSGSELDPASDAFSWATKVGVQAMQSALGLPVDGVLHLGQAAFLPGAARITALGQQTILGTAAQPGAVIASATSTNRTVSIALDVSLESEVKVGDPVTITLPNQQTTPGVVSSVGRVATTSSGSGPNPGGNQGATVDVEVTPTDPAATGTFDQASVQVSITTATVPDALVVPVDALLAPAGGGYALEEVMPGGVHRLVAATTGLFDDADGLVQVSGAGLAAGRRVVVPAS